MAELGKYVVAELVGNIYDPQRNNDIKEEITNRALIEEKQEGS